MNKALPTIKWPSAERWLELVNSFIWWTLAGLTVVLAVSAVAPGWVLTQMNSPENEIAIGRRAILLIGTLGVGGMTAGLRPYLVPKSNSPVTADARTDNP